MMVISNLILSLSVAALGMTSAIQPKMSYSDDLADGVAPNKVYTFENDLDDYNIYEKDYEAVNYTSSIDQHNLIDLNQGRHQGFWVFVKEIKLQYEDDGTPIIERVTWGLSYSGVNNPSSSTQFNYSFDKFLSSYPIIFLVGQSEVYFPLTFGNYWFFSYGGAGLDWSDNTTTSLVSFHDSETLDFGLIDTGSAWITDLDYYSISWAHTRDVCKMWVEANIKFNLQAYEDISQYYYATGNILRQEEMERLTTAGRTAGYEEGYRKGFSDGEQGTMEGPQAVMTLFQAIVGVPFQALNGISSFTIWSVPIISIIFSFLMLGIFLWIVRKFI